MAEQWLSIVEYARATGISDMTIRRRIRCGRIKAELREGKYYIPLAMDSDAQSAPRAQRPESNPSIVKSRPAQISSEPADARSPMPVVHRAPQFSQPVQVTQSHIQVSSRDVPESLARPLIDAGLASVEARALIEFCDRALEQAKSTVQAVEHKYAARVDALNAELHNRNMEIKNLNQQIEDLQLLVQILERKKIG